MIRSVSGKPVLPGFFVPGGVVHPGLLAIFAGRNRLVGGVIASFAGIRRPKGLLPFGAYFE